MLLALILGIILCLGLSLSGILLGLAMASLIYNKSMWQLFKETFLKGDK